MATISTFTFGGVNSKSLVLGIREALQMPFDLGQWTELRMGVFWDFVSNAAGDTTTGVDETISVANAASNMFTMGIKDSTPALPGSIDTVFFGSCPRSLTDTQRLALFSSTRYLLDDTNFFSPKAINGATFSTYFSGGIRTGNTPATSTTFYGMKFVLSGRGTAAQQVTISETAYANPDVTDVSITNLRSKLGTSAFGGSGSSQTWWTTNGSNAGGTPLSIPNSIFIRSPFFNNRMRIHALVLERYAP